MVINALTSSVKMRLFSKNKNAMTSIHCSESTFYEMQLFLIFIVQRKY